MIVVIVAISLLTTITIAALCVKKRKRDHAQSIMFIDEDVTPDMKDSTAINL